MSRPRVVDVAIAGGGIVGVACARALAKQGLSVCLLEPRMPLSLTSAASTECYRDFWPTKTMTSFMNRSISLIEEFAAAHKNAVAMTRRGYAYVSTERTDLERQATQSERLGMVVRRHASAASHTYVPSVPLSDCAGALPSSFMKQTKNAGTLGSATHGIDLLLGQEAVTGAFPFLTPDAQCVLHARRAGWVSAHVLGSELLNEAKAMGVQVVRGRLDRVLSGKGRLAGVEVALSTGGRCTVACGSLINAAGPQIHRVHDMVRAGFGAKPGATREGSDGIHPMLIKHEVHAKAIFRDAEGVVPRDCPLIIWNDAQRLEWDPEEREHLEEDARGGSKTAERLLSKLPGGAHLRPYGHDSLLLLWECWHGETPVKEPGEIEFDDMYAEVALRGLSRMIPGLARYIHRMPRSTVVDGGYYTKAPDNIPLAGAVGPGAPSVYSAGALSGYGIMGSMGTADLLTELVTGSSTVAPYAAALSPARFTPEYVFQCEQLSREEAGQL